MAASHAMVAHDVARITHLANVFASTQVVETTNKRMVMWCPDLHCARALAIRIGSNGYQYELRKGLKTDAYYVQAFY